MTDMPKITEAGRKILMSSVDSRPFDGLVTFGGSGTGVGLMRATWTKSVVKLEEAGLLLPYVHGGYELTEEGHRIRDELVAEANPKGPKP